MDIRPTIRATVSPEAIDKVTRLFNGSDSDIFAELFQNARRAGANRIDVSHHSENGVNWITVTDNGCGISDPARMLALGASNWTDSLATREDPAGMGLYSCAGRATRITSSNGTNGFHVDIPADGWLGRTDLAVIPRDHSRGTSISFALGNDIPPTGPGIIARAARYLPVPTFHDGAEVPRHDFLEGAHLILPVMGTRVGVYVGNHDQYRDNVNFHGVTLRHTLPHLCEVYHRRWSIKIDIEDAPELKLVLPARKELVQNAFLARIEAAWRAAIYIAIDREASHSLSHIEWNKAQDAGIELAPAAAELRPWAALEATQTMRPETSPASLPSNPAILEQTDACSGQMIAHATAITGTPALPDFLWPEPDFAGYDWYDALPRYAPSQFRLRNAETTQIIDDDRSDTSNITRPESIQIILDGGDHEIALNSQIYLADPDYCGCDPDLLDVAVTRSATIAPDELAHIIELAAFCPCEDSDSDSWDTQQAAFRNRAIERAYAILEGDEAARLARIRSEFNDHVSWHIPSGLSLNLTYDGTTITAAFTPVPALHTPTQPI